MSEGLGALAKALAAAQSEMGDAKKDATNPHFRSKYATLAAVREAVTKPLAKHGLAVVQTFEPHGDAGICIVTTLIHEGGASIESKLYIPVQKKDAQGFGSAISYGRRYSLAAIVGIASDDDDDAEASVTREKPANSNGLNTESLKLEMELQLGFETSKDAEALSAVEVKAAKAIQAGQLTGAARDRLRKYRAEAVKRLAAAS